MSLSDCPECWNTPCRCGHEYESWTPADLRSQIAMLERVLARKPQTENLCASILDTVRPQRVPALSKPHIMLRRVNNVLGETFQRVQQEVTLTEPEDFDSAFANALMDVSFGEHYGDKPLNVGMKDFPNADMIVSALNEQAKAGQPFGPVEIAALDYLACLMRCDQIIEHALQAEGTFSTVLTYEGDYPAFQLGLKVGLSRPDSLASSLVVENASKLQLKFEAIGPTDGNELKQCRVSGSMAFTLRWFKDEATVSLHELKDILRVVLAPKVGHTAVRIALQNITVTKQETQ